MAHDSNRSWVKQQLVEVLTGIQRDSGREAVGISDGTVPLDHLPGFDSLSGVETEVLLSERLGIELRNVPFTEPRTGRCRTVVEIADALVADHPDLQPVPASVAGDRVRESAG
jgi:hypothetical protein